MSGATTGVSDDLFAWGAGLDDLVGARVTQCALSRICGACGESLSRPVAFLGTPVEQGRNAFHQPPLHAACAEQVSARPDADPAWAVVLTSGFEFVRAGAGDEDRRPTFQPNSLL